MIRKHLVWSSKVLFHTVLLSQKKKRKKKIIICCVEPMCMDVEVAHMELDHVSFLFWNVRLIGLNTDTTYSLFRSLFSLLHRLFMLLPRTLQAYVLTACVGVTVDRNMILWLLNLHSDVFVAMLRREWNIQIQFIYWFTCAWMLTEITFYKRLLECLKAERQTNRQTYD